LTAAYYLARKGHSVVVHEALESPGGMLLTGIPEYRYPRELLEKDIAAIREAGVEIRSGSPVDEDSFERLTAENEALYLATGAHLAKRIEVPGGDSEGVYWGVDFLRERALGKLSESEFEGMQVAVVGGGNVAVDAARVARRLGAEGVTVVSLENPEELPAWAWEVEEGVEEGLDFLHRWGPEEILTEGGHVSSLRLKRCTHVFDDQGRFSPAYDESETKEIPAEAVILAIGQDPSSEAFAACGLRPGGTIECKTESTATGAAKVFAGGDVVTGPKSFIEAVAAGRAAASEMDHFLGGDGVIEEKLVDEEPVEHRLGKVIDFASLRRLEPRRLTAEARVGSFAALEQSFTDEQVAAEAGRCLHCDLRLAFEAPEKAPRGEALLPFTEAAVAAVPETEGVFQLYDEEKNVLAIKGAMDLREDLQEALEENESARFFTFEEDPMYTKRESELIQKYLQEHGELPGGGDDELDDLF
jgi:NADPH-dependent glutamate synthase beta subunit-like oxidoreductase